jgi:hypothetical protein
MIEEISPGFFKHTCERCGHVWVSKIREPGTCASKICTSKKYWNKPRKIIK